MFESLKGKIIRGYIPMTILDELNGVVTFAQGHRTQAVMVLYATVEVLKTFGVINASQASSIQQVLMPIAGATFAAKISRIGAIGEGVVKVDIPS